MRGLETLRGESFYISIWMESPFFPDGESGSARAPNCVCEESVDPEVTHEEASRLYLSHSVCLSVCR